MLRLDGIKVRRATGKEELEWIFRLRYQNYLRKGYIAQNPSGMMSDKWDGSPVTTHLLALSDGEAVGAVRLITDSADGLPMERVFPEEMADLRKRESKLAEASALVTASDHEKPSQGVWLVLCREIWSKAEAADIDELCIAVTRNHLPFYRKLRFRCMGAGRCYKSLNDVFAYPLHVPVKKFQLKHKLCDIPTDAPVSEFLLEPRRQKNHGG